MFHYHIRARNALVAACGIVAVWPLVVSAQPAPIADPFQRSAKAPRDESPQPLAPRVDGGEAAVLAALERRLDFDFTETPLADVAEFIGKSAKFNVDIDERSLEEVGIGRDTPISFQAKDLRLVSALRLILQQMDLTHTIRDGGLLITTPEEAESELITRVYPVGHLISVDRSFESDESPPTGELIEVITSTIRPTTWDEIGGPGSVRGFRNTLVVQQTRDVHDEVADILAALREAVRIAATGDAPKVAFFPQPLDGVSEDEAKIYKALDAPAEVSCIEEPLSDVIGKLAKTTGVSLQIDDKALEEVGIGRDTPVTRNIKGVSLRTVLRLMLSQMDLTYVVRNDVLLITTPEECESELITYVFPVADLVDRDSDDDGFRALGKLLVAAIRPTTWEEVGGPGAVEDACGCLIISQTDEVLREIVPLLAGLRKIQSLAKATPDRAVTDTISLHEIEMPALAKLRAKVNAPLGMAAYERMPLAEIVAALSEASGVPIQFDEKALEEFGVDAQVLTSASLGGETLGQALRRLLRRQQLTWMLSDDVVLITTPDDAANILETRLYPVSDLVIARERLDDHSTDFDELIKSIEQTIASNSWEEVGGPGAIVPSPVASTLVVSQTADVHDQIAKLLADMRAVVDKDEAPVPAAAPEKLLSNKAGKRLYLQIYKLKSPRPEDAQAIAETIGELVEHESWKSGELYFVRGVTGAVIVRHTAAAQRKVRQLLVELDVMAGVNDRGEVVGAGDSDEEWPRGLGAPLTAEPTK